MVFRLRILITLQKALGKKDTHEKASKEKHESLSIKPAPIMRTLQVQCSKMRIIHTFLIPSGMLYVFLMIGRAFESPIYWITVGHVLLDLYGVGVSKIHDRASLIILLSFTVLFAGGNVLIDYIVMDTLGNASSFGNLTDTRNPWGAVSDGTYGVFADQEGNNTTMDYVTIATTGNATDFGASTEGRSSSGTSDGSRGVLVEDIIVDLKI